MGWVWHGWRRAVVGAVAIATVVVLFPTVAVARDRLPGIDVSKYQRTIDWRRVATTNVRFAILRASLGNTYVDTKYRRNVAGATRHGIVVGAYHFAKPNRSRWDARGEARHFLRVARNAPGDVVPVLDLEDSGGLSRIQLQRWARRWLGHVERQLGVRPMIYSGNFFWSRYMGDTSWFGRRGYAHWVAHWGVRRPDVPGRGWGGRGWTFWQFSATGRVHGIRGPVDLDWFGGGDLTHGTIASVRLERPVDGAIEGPQLSCGLEGEVCRRLVNPRSTVVLRARPANGARFLRWTGDCAGTAPICRLDALGSKTVSALFRRSATASPPAASASTAAASASRAVGSAIVSDPGEAPKRPDSRRCRMNDAGCAIAAVLTNAVDRLREVLPVLPPIGGRG